MAWLFPYGGGVFRFFNEIDEDEQEEIQEELIDCQKATLGSKREAMRRVEEFRAALERTCIDYLGIVDRAASLEKTADAVEEQLARRLRQARVDGAAAFAHKLIVGDEMLAPHLRPTGGDILGLVSARMVRDGAQVLRKIDPAALFAKVGVRVERDFRRWRQLYLDAADAGNVLLVGVC